MLTKAIAHVRTSDMAEQSVETHLIETAEVAKTLAAKLNLASAGELLGLMHDFGKIRRHFRNQSSNGHKL